MTSNEAAALISRRVGMNEEGQPIWAIWSSDKEGKPINGWEPGYERRLNISMGVGAYQYTTLTIEQARALAINILDKVGV